MKEAIKTIIHLAVSESIERGAKPKAIILDEWSYWEYAGADESNTSFMGIEIKREVKPIHSFYLALEIE